MTLRDIVLLAVAGLLGLTLAAVRIAREVRDQRVIGRELRGYAERRRRDGGWRG